MFKDETISITDTIQNIRDISKIFTAFSKQFNLPASAAVNKIFKHYYKFNINDGFDARFKIDAEIRLNGITYKKGKVLLTGVKMKNNSPDTYKIIFFGETVGLKDSIGDDDLSVLDALAVYDHRPQDMNAGFFTGLSTGGTPSSNRDVVYPLISIKDQFSYDSGTPSTFNLHSMSFADLDDNLKPAIKMTHVIDAIESEYDDITFSSDFFGSDVFSELYLWLHRESEPLEALSGLRRDKVTEADWTLSGGLEKFPLITTSTVSYEFKFQLFTASSTPYGVVIRDRKSNDILHNQDGIVGSGTIIIDLDSGQTDRTYDMEVVVTAAIVLVFTSTLLTITKIEVGETNLIATYTGGITLLDRIYIQDNTPKFKIIDLLTNLFKMFNLTAYVENDIIVVKTLDDYMTAGTSHDITKYVRTDKNDINRFTPFSNINFKYSDPATKTSLQFVDKFSQVFGDLNYNAADRYDGISYDISLDMEHTQLINIQDSTPSFTGIVYGLFIGASDDTVVGSPYLFFNKYNNVASNPIINSGTEDDYNAPSNSTLDGNHSLNFGLEFDEYTRTSNEHSLFKRFYEQYIVKSFNIKSRIITIKAVLPLRILTSYNLNDTFIIGSNEYFINSVKTNITTNESDLELIPKFEDYTTSILT